MNYGASVQMGVLEPHRHGTARHGADVNRGGWRGTPIQALATVPANDSRVGKFSQGDSTGRKAREMASQRSQTILGEHRAHSSTPNHSPHSGTCDVFICPSSQQDNRSIYRSAVIDFATSKSRGAQSLQIVE